MIKIKKETQYIGLVYLLGFINWSISYWSANEILVSNLNITTSLIAIFSIAFLLFKKANIIYSIPIVFAFIFSIGLPNLNLDDIGYTIIIFIGLIVLITGLIYRLVTSGNKIKLNSLGLGLLLAAVSIFIPFLYTEFTLNNFVISTLGFFYVILYLTYSNLINKEDRNFNINFLMKTAIGVSSLLLLQLLSHYMDQLSNYNNIDFYSKLIDLIKTGWVGDFPRWGNINDLTIHLVLFSFAPIHYMMKDRDKLWPWIYLLVTGVMIYISFSRGSMVTFLILFIILTIYAFNKRKTHLKLFKNYLISLVTLIILMILAFDITMVIFGLFRRELPNLIDPSTWNVLLSGRVSLYGQAIDKWLTNPLYFLFGGGWFGDGVTSITGDNRIIIYHSTFFHVLATGGLVGISVLIYHFMQVFNIFKKSRYRRVAIAFLITYLLTQFHGLIDNTQYMIHYMIVVLLIFSIIEPSDKNVIIDTTDL